MTDAFKAALNELMEMSLEEFRESGHALGHDGPMHEVVRMMVEMQRDENSPDITEGEEMVGKGTNVPDIAQTPAEGDES